MLGIVAALVSSALTVWSPTIAVAPAPTATPIPEGIQATFVELSEQQGVAAVTYTHQGAQRTTPLASDALVRERAIGGTWTSVPATALRPGAPVVVFVNAGRVTQIDTLYGEVATRFIVVKNGYGVTPAGAIYRLVERARTAGEGLPQGAYVLLRVTPGTTTAFDLAASNAPFVDKYAQAVKVNVTIEVLVPVNTPSSDVVYMATDALSWTPNAIRLQPLPGNRWSVTLSLTGGTLLKYKYTRGSWQSQEVDAAGNQIDNRALTVSAKGPSQTVKDNVARWADRQS